MACKRRPEPEQIKKRLTQTGGEELRQPFHYLFNLFCFQFRIVSVEYFMDVMPIWEINDIIDNIPYLDRNLWEASRVNAWVGINTMSREKVSMSDVMSFRWEEDQPETTKSTEISTSDIIRLKEMSKHIRV